MTSPRRLKQVRLLSLFTCFLSFGWFLLSNFLGQKELSLWILGSSVLFLAVYFMMRQNWFTPARILYMIILNTGVTITASYIGQPGNVEFILLFGLGLPFLMFSFRSERVLMAVFAFIPILAWLLLFNTDFNLVTSSKIDPRIAAKTIYPFSLASTFLLVGFQTCYFAFLNAGYYSRVHDKRQEAEEASTAKSRFLSTMSHEIRTPLNAVIGLSHILRDNNPREDQKENVDALNYSGKLLLQLLNNVLDYSKMEANEFQLDPIPTDLNLALRQLNKIHEPNCIRKSIYLSVEIDEDIPMVWLDIVRFNQVLNNLINNAIKFTERGGVTVRLRTLGEDDGYTHLSVAVMDTGIGIAPDKQGSVFEAFKQEESSTQRLYGGTGLGLSIVKEIIEEMDSEIELRSEVGKGSTFQFELQLKMVNDAEIARFEQKASHDLTGVRALLVEDNAINEMVGRQILEKEGVLVDSAVNGQVALELAKANDYDIILMDIQMPVMDGYEASRQIRKFNKEIPILALSASVFMEVKDKIYSAGMNGFIFKPFDPNNLFDRIAASVKIQSRKNILNTALN